MDKETKYYNRKENDISLLEYTDLIRIKANSILGDNKVEYSQFFTPLPICMFMVSLFEEFGNKVEILDPGCGPGSLTAAIIQEVIFRGKTGTLSVDAYDIDDLMKLYVSAVFEKAEIYSKRNRIKLQSQFINKDYIIDSVDSKKLYSHVIMNPPYAKIRSSSVGLQTKVDNKSIKFLVNIL